MSRLRLTVAFVLAMALLLALAGTFLYLSVRSALDEQIDESLSARADDVAALVRRAGPDAEGLGFREESFAVVGTSLLEPDEVARARRGATRVDRDDARMLALPVEGSIVVVGTSLEDRDEALAALLTQLLIGGPLALLLASVAGYALAAATLRPVLRRLEAGLERERRFVAEASHELRTPLASLKAELELALRRPRSAEELRDAVVSAAEETDRLALLADDLLVLARSDEGALGLKLERVRAKELLDTVAGRFAARAEEGGRRIAVDAPGELELEGDRVRLEQALGNLVDNALRHGSGTIRLEARGTELSVADEGPGFPTAFLPRAFERFTRADEARVRGAAGLGLALVDAIARAHGGTATAANGPQGGAVVTLVLPAHRALIRES